MDFWCCGYTKNADEQASGVDASFNRNNIVHIGRC